MKWPILKIEETSRENFIEFWSRQYAYPNEELYNKNIGKPLTEKRIWELYEWKNGSRISARKQASILKHYINNKEKPPLNSSEEKLTDYLNQGGGAIWRIFWLHCHAPAQYPIYDQHVHRAMAALKKWKITEIPAHDPTKIKIYLREYLPFWQEFKNHNQRKIDKALWAYGKWRKTQ